MNINRHNYEEYFILYMDNELSAEDRRLVEAFVSAYPDLKEELDLLMQYKFQPERIELPGKEELWKGSDLIHPGNQTEWFILYLDGELSSTEKNRVAQYILNEPAAANEWALLQKTRLVEEAIVFENKESLYRREEEKRRAIPLYFFRIAAVIMLALIGLGLFYILSDQDPTKSSKPGLASIKDQRPSDDSNLLNSLPEISPTTKNDDPKLAEGNKIASVRSEEKLKYNPSPIEIPEKEIKEAVAVEKEKKPSNDLPLPVNNPRIKLDENALAYSLPEDDLRNKTLNAIVPEVTNPTIAPSDIKTAVYDPIEEWDQDNGNGKKNRHRGFFRTIARTFEKRTKVDPTDDNKLLVAGFRISLK